MINGLDIDVEDGEVEDDGLDGDDLYGDLESNIFERSSNRNFSTRDELEKQITELKETVQKIRKDRIVLKSKIRSLARGNAVILSNAEALYETAKFEIGRKNAMLTQLQKRFQELTKHIDVGTRVSKEDIEEILRNCGDITRETHKVKSMECIRLAVEEFKRQLTETRNNSRRCTNWSKKIRYSNMSVYFHSEQIPFDRLEKVTFHKSRFGDQHSLDTTVPVDSTGKVSESVDILNDSTICARLQDEFRVNDGDTSSDAKVRDVPKTRGSAGSLVPSKVSVDEGERKWKSSRRSTSNSLSWNHDSQKYSQRYRPRERNLERIKSSRSDSHEHISRDRMKRRRSRSRSKGHDRDSRDHRRDYDRDWKRSKNI